MAENDHFNWPMLTFKWFERVEVYRICREDDPNGQPFPGWWPGRIVGCECRKYSMLHESHVLYQVELDGVNGTLMRMPNEIRAIKQAEQQAEQQAEAPAK